VQLIAASYEITVKRDGRGLTFPFPAYKISAEFIMVLSEGKGRLPAPTTPTGEIDNG
jgi:hypothetical protein